jgi:hypothetical protein
MKIPEQLLACSILIIYSFLRCKTETKRTDSQIPPKNPAKTPYPSLLTRQFLPTQHLRHAHRRAQTRLHAEDEEGEGNAWVGAE